MHDDGKGAKHHVPLPAPPQILSRRDIGERPATKGLRPVQRCHMVTLGKGHHLRARRRPAPQSGSGNGVCVRPRHLTRNDGVGATRLQTLDEGAHKARTTRNRVVYREQDVGFRNQGKSGLARGTVPLPRHPMHLGPGGFVGSLGPVGQDQDPNGHVLVEQRRNPKRNPPMGRHHGRNPRRRLFRAGEGSSRSACGLQRSSVCWVNRSGAPEQRRDLVQPYARRRRASEVQVHPPASAKRRAQGMQVSGPEPMQHQG